MEDFPNSIEQRKGIVSEKECRKIAEDILARYQQAILEKVNYPVDDGGLLEPAMANVAIEKNLRKIPSQTLREYRGHGVTRGNHVDRLTAAISILENEAMKGDCARLAESGRIDAYADGDFLAVSRKGDQFMEWSGEGGDRRPVFVSLGENEYTGKDIRAVKIRPGALVVNAYFYPIVEELRRMFPGKKILYANELQDYIKSEEASA
jgi:hypothetical protein